MSGLICFWSYSHFWLPSLCQRHLTIKIVAQTFQYTILKETIFSLTEFFTIFFTLLPLCPTNLSILPLFQLVLVKQFYFWAFFLMSVNCLNSSPQLILVCQIQKFQILQNCFTTYADIICQQQNSKNSLALRQRLKQNISRS